MLGNCAVSAVATPSITKATSPSTCSRNIISNTITPTARNPGISRTVCSQPMSEPSKSATSMTKLFNNADHVENAIGIAAAIKNNKVTGRRQNGRVWASEREMVFIQIALPLPARIVEPRIPCKQKYGRNDVKNLSEDMVTVENLKTSGKTTQLNAVKYHEVRDAMLRAMTKDAPSLTIAEIKFAAPKHLPENMFPGGDKLDCWQKAVQLDFEAKGVIKRATTKPLRFSLLTPSLLQQYPGGVASRRGLAPSYFGVNTHTPNRNFGDQYRSPYATRRAV
jgi:hypothetical protein